MHVNLFSNGHSRREIHKALREHYERDSRILFVIDAVLGGSVLYLIRNLPTDQAIAIAVAIGATVTGLRYFIDQSNRNFYLHRLDWEAAGPDDPLG